MRLVAVIEEDFVNYKKPSMVLGFPYCDFKCERENPALHCQNKALSETQLKDYSVDSIISLYLNNPITEAIVCQGLEPFESFNELYDFIKTFRKYSQDDIVIYTGFYKEELLKEINELKEFPNIIIKFGRLLPSSQPHKDEILGVFLYSDNQYAEQIS